MSTSNIWSEKKARPTIIGTIITFLLALALSTIYTAALFNVIGLLLTRFASNLTFPTEIQSHVANLFTWGTIMNIGVSAGLSVVKTIISFLRKEKTSLIEKISIKIAQLFSKNKNMSILELAPRASIVQHIIMLIPAIFNVMVDLHAFGLFFGIEQQPFIRGLFSFGSFANIFWPSLVMIGYVTVTCVKQFLAVKVFSAISSQVDEETKKKREAEYEEWQKREEEKVRAAREAVARDNALRDKVWAAIEKHNFSQYTEIECKFYGSSERELPCYPEVWYIVDCIALRPREPVTTDEYVKLLETFGTREEVIEFFQLYYGGYDLNKYGLPVVAKYPFD